MHGPEMHVVVAVPVTIKLGNAEIGAGNSGVVDGRYEFC